MRGATGWWELPDCGGQAASIVRAWCGCISIPLALVMAYMACVILVPFHRENEKQASFYDCIYEAEIVLDNP